jgi:hypothetical protein
MLIVKSGLILVIICCAIVFGLIGYFIGANAETPSQPEIVPEPEEEKSEEQIICEDSGGIWRFGCDGPLTDLPNTIAGCDAIGGSWEVRPGTNGFWCTDLEIIAEGVCDSVGGEWTYGCAVRID